MFCTKCGAKNDDIAVFCGKCGKPLKANHNNTNNLQQKQPDLEQAAQTLAVHQRPKAKRPIIIGITVAVVLVIAVVAGILVNGAYDPTQKEIEKLEGQNVKIISKKIVASVNSLELSAGSIIDYSVYYNYSLIGGAIKPYTQKSNITIELSDPSLASIENINSVTITNSAKSGASLKVTVKYKKLSEIFYYTIK